MKPLASKNLPVQATLRVARAAAFAAPALLVECGGVPQRQPPPVPVVIIGPPKAAAPSGTPPVIGSEGGQGEIRKAMRTELNAGIYPGCRIEARLSVILGDDSLARIVLDPKADFWVLSEAHPSNIHPLLVIFSLPVRACAGVPECDISSHAVNAIAQSSGLNVIVRFDPAPYEALLPSDTEITISARELRAYCP